MSKKIFIVVTLLLILFAGVYYLVLKRPTSRPSDVRVPIHLQNSTALSGCLKDNEYADYTVDRRYVKNAKIPTVPVTVFIRDRLSNESKNSFEIGDLLPLLRVERCGVYVTREFNKGLPNVRDELWRYDYTGKGAEILTLASFKDKSIEGTYYESAFRVDPQEKYVVLVRGYTGQSDYALVIKDLSNLKDLFVLTLYDLEKLAPDMALGSFSTGLNLGDFEIKAWTDDYRYLWGTLFDGARDTAYYRIDMSSWKTEVFPSPVDLPTGAEHVESPIGYLVYADFPTFFGIDVIAQQEQEKFRQDKKLKHLYLYNLRTKEKTLLAAISDPGQHFNPKWFSDTELQYTLPSGEVKTYTIK